MSLDSETKTALAEELEDVVMELADVSQLSPSQEKLTTESILQAIQSEATRLCDITELYNYPELHKIMLWAHQNILALKSDPDLFLQKNQTGFFYTWLELLATLLREDSAELLSELQENLQHTDWKIDIDAQYLQDLINSLTENPTNNKTHNYKVEKSELLSPEELDAPHSSYQLAWADDVHPELLEAFFIETPDLVTSFVEHIKKISNGGEGKKTHQSAARVAHTIKGSSAVVGINAVASLAHKLEDILEYSVEHKLPKEVSELLLESADCLEDMFDSLTTQKLAPQQYPQLLELLSQWDQKFSAGYVDETNNEEMDKNNKKETSTNKHYSLAWDKDIHPELLEAYMSETPAHVVEISQLLRTISKEPVDAKTYKKASRLSHTIKGTSAVIGISAVANLSHQLEEIFDYAIDNPLPQSLLPLLDESANLLESLYDSLLSEGIPPKEYLPLYKKLCGWKQHTNKTSTRQEKPKKKKTENTPIKLKGSATKKELSDKTTSTSTPFNIDFPPLQELLSVAPPIVPATTTAPTIQRANINESTLRIPVSIIEELLNFSSELITTNTQLAEHINALIFERKNTSERNERIRNMLDELEWAVDQQTRVSTKPSYDKRKADFDSLEMDSYNELHSITGLLSESIDDDREMSVSLMQELNSLKGQINTQKRVNRELNNTVLNMRMEPIKILTPRLERIVRETCRRTNKQAKLEITGDELSIDTDVIKGLIDPLLHLLRNAVDHGIELPENRTNKDKIGKIQLNFAQQGDQVILTLKDDGIGIDAEKIYQTALKKGLVTTERKLSKNEKLRLILEAGFSTQEKVTEISGRGVGMDVVNTAVKNMSGNINISSQKNKGSEIQLQVPLTLSTANVLLVKVLDSTVAIPSVSIQQVHYLTQDKLIAKGSELFIAFQEKHIPLLSLSALLTWPTTPFISGKNQSVIIVKYQTKYFALYVNEILKPQEITLKTLKPWMTDVTGVNGVCLLANGVVAPVLNMFDLLRTLDKNIISPIFQNDSETTKAEKNEILVVDDSLSNRKALSLMLQALDYNVSTAIDGFDALQKIEKTQFKLVITDLEMPKMDGLELIESLRAWPETQQLPVIMVTSRSTEKHRTLADQAGVNAYLTKPVDNATLKSTVGHFLSPNSATYNSITKFGR